MIASKNAVARMFSLKSLLSKKKTPSVPAAGSGGTSACLKRSQRAQQGGEQKNEHKNKSKLQPEPHMTALSDDILRVLFKCLPPKATASLLQSCKSLAKLSADAWKAKLYAMRDEYVIPYEERSATIETSLNTEIRSDGTNSAPITAAKHYRVELQKRYLRVNRYRPNIERWGEEPYWFVNHPCPSSPFNAVRRAHDVTDFRISAQTNRLEKGRYSVNWRVNSTSGFCVLQLDTEVYSECRGGGSTRDNVQRFSSLWNTREDRGKGWTDICATGGEVIEIGPNGGYIKARMWKRELDFTGGILIDYLEIQKLEPVPPLMNSRLLMSSW